MLVSVIRKMNTKVLRSLKWSTSVFSNIYKPRENVLRMFSAAATMKDESKSHSTVDSEDVKRHSKYMKEWWDPNGPMKALHAYNLIRVPFIRDGLVQCPPESRNLTPLKDMKILDVGCGGGLLSEPLARLGAEVTGIDASNELIEAACKHSAMDPRLTHNMPTYLNVTVEEHVNTRQDYYDGVVASEVIEHVNNKELFIKSCIKALKPEGRIFFTTPSRTRISQLTTICISEYVLNLVPKGTHQIEKFVTPTELTFLLERNDCHVEVIHGIFYNPLTNHWSWVNTQEFVFALQAVKLK